MISEMSESSDQLSDPFDHLGGSSPTRRTTFEEHTKNKRMAVRSMAANSPDAPQDTSSQSRQKFHQKFHSRKATNSPTDSSSTPGRGFLGRPSTSHKNSVQQAPDQPLTESSLSTTSTFAPESNCEERQISVPAFDYGKIVPELIPDTVKKDFLNAPIPLVSDPSVRRHKSSRILKTLGNQSNSSEAPTETSSACYPRTWKSSQPPFMLPPKVKASARSRQTQSIALKDFSTDLWTEISRFLSTQDLKNLRLVNQQLARALAPIQYRNVVVNFGRSFFLMTNADWDGKTDSPPRQSMFKKYGKNFNQFGISFEYDVHGLTYAKPKVIEKEQEAWFGKFTWPTEHYPRFPALQTIEDLVDNNRPLLKETFESITKASELGLCIDSGHGWLEGPDISDLALFNRRVGNGGKIFGKTFKSGDVWTEFSRNEYFKWAQQNTINDTIKYLMENRVPTQDSAAKEVRFLDNLKIRDFESFREQNNQYDFDPSCHVGGVSNDSDDHQQNHVAILVHANPPTIRQRRTAGIRPSSTKRLPQWPLLFNGYNLAAESGGHCTFIQNKTGNPLCAPLQPGSLTEAQAQWLMETVWAQRAFLSAYTTAIITNKEKFTSIHTLRISKLSSGLLPSLEQREFWTSLPGLKQLQMLIIPDWRQEHNTGDRAYATNMPIPPGKAAQKFTDFLRVHVVKIETLHTLTIGYVGGGEHAEGIFARNQHVLPAPIVDDPNDWLNSSIRKSSFLTKFDHIRDLKFENCWFSPLMLQEFMKRSRDTSLHSLTLDSVSLLTSHDPSIDSPLTTSGSNLKCQYPREEWAREVLPSGATWSRVLDSITPGKTLLEYKYDAGLIDREEHPMPKKLFRGHIQRIILNSCGYVKISLPKGRSSTFNQNSVVIHLYSPMDSGIRIRKERFNRRLSTSSNESSESGPGIRNRHNRALDDSETSKRVMMSTTSPGGDVYPWLGTLTQCVHPIEKRVLEEAWQMRFGWPDDLDRWAAVEDGCYEGGTGRFSGVVTKHFSVGHEVEDI